MVLLGEAGALKHKGADYPQGGERCLTRLA